MKKIHALIAAVVVLAAASVAVIVNAGKPDSFFEANVEALADQEAGFFGADPCENMLNNCLFICPGCGEKSYIPGQNGPVNVDNIYGKCVKCGYEIAR